MRVIDSPGDGWVSLAQLADPGGRAQRHRLIAAAAGRAAPAHLPVVWELEAVAWFVGAVFGAGLIAGVGPRSPEPEQTWVRIGASGLAERIALPPDALGVGSGTATARAAMTRLLAPIIDSDRRRSNRVLWWHVGDRIADATLWCGEAFGAHAGAGRIAEELLAPGVPYSVPLGPVTPGGVRVRRTCCLSRRTQSAEICEGCPHRR